MFLTGANLVLLFKSAGDLWKKGAADLTDAELLKEIGNFEIGAIDNTSSVVSFIGIPSFSKLVTSMLQVLKMTLLEEQQ